MEHPTLAYGLLTCDRIRSLDQGWSMSFADGSARQALNDWHVKCFWGLGRNGNW
jgi:hypothetical protein